MIFFIILLILLIIVLFFHLNPEFGGKISKEQRRELQQLPNYTKRNFVNQIPTPMEMKPTDGFAILWEFFRGAEGRQPNIKLPVQKLQPDSIGGSHNRVTWFGHSTFLVELHGKVILIDPMFSSNTSPIPYIGPKRYTMEFPLKLKELPAIDIVLISHDHYDHLDRRSIKTLKSKTKQFIVPLGVENHLIRWGVAGRKITSLNWWQQTKFEDLQFIAAPSRHFSGRGMLDGSATLWCSYIIKSGIHKIYFSGDSGYGPHFKEIYEKYGKFDLALLECGQYNQKWKNIHMLPEQTVQAAVDLQADYFMPIHWSGFTLSVHGWTEPVERAIAKATKLNQPITTPRIGESIDLDKKIFPQEKWWLIHKTI